MKGCRKINWSNSCMNRKCGEKLLLNSPTGNILRPGEMYESHIVLLCPECRVLGEEEK